jgi:predicted SPOUT superfamily RNA methylase MTH1
MTLTVLLPASLVADVPDLRQKTAKVGIIGRALAIFRVDRVCVYDDHEPKLADARSEMRLIKALLEYMETPQYLRKLLFGRTWELKYAGILPPLRTPHHPTFGERTSHGSIREGVVLSPGKGSSLVELGLGKRGVLNERLKAGTRVTVRILKDLGDRLLVERVSRSELKNYWGYQVFEAPSLREAVGMLRDEFVVGTSKYGKDIADVAEELAIKAPIALVLGGPYAGLLEICLREGVRPEDMFDVIVNTIPDQGTETVRTEEALLASLSILNFVRKVYYCKRQKMNTGA